MTRFRTLALAALLALGFSLVPVPLHAQAAVVIDALDKFLAGDPVSGAYGAISQDVPLIIKYVGTQASATVAVTGNNAILFKSGAAGSEAADTSITGCGGTAGTLDLTNAACSNLGKVVDIINATTTWRAIILDGLRTDATNGNLANLTATATGCTSVDGQNINSLTTGALEMSMALTPYRTIAPYLVTRPSTTAFPGPQVVIQNPFVGQRATFYIGNAKVTTGGAATFTIYSVKVAESGGAAYNPGVLTSAGGSETVTTLYSAPAGATTVLATLDVSNWGIKARRNEKLLFRVSATSSLTVGVMYAYGFSYFYR